MFYIHFWILCFYLFFTQSVLFTQKGQNDQGFSKGFEYWILVKKQGFRVLDILKKTLINWIACNRPCSVIGFFDAFLILKGQKTTLTHAEYALNVNVWPLEILNIFVLWIQQRCCSYFARIRGRSNNTRFKRRYSCPCRNVCPRSVQS